MTNFLLIAGIVTSAMFLGGMIAVSLLRAGAAYDKETGIDAEDRG